MGSLQPFAARARFTLLVLTLTSQPAITQSPQRNVDAAGLSGRIWKVAESTPQAAAGSILIFLPNGTLLMTSCGEPYRVALWKRDAKNRGTLHVVEDGRPSQTLTVIERKAGSARLTQTLAHNSVKETLVLRALDAEFVCPDLPK